MWNRIITIMVTFTLFSNLVISASEPTTHNSIITYITSDIAENEEVFRGDCVASIMKLIGVDRKSAEMNRDADYDQPVFNDLCDDDLNTGYIIESKFAGIAVGTGVGNFEPNRIVTVKECLTFMSRCFQSEKMGTDVALEKAKENGLVYAEDNFIQDIDANLKQEDFCLLLTRMLQQKRYKYYAREDNHFSMYRCVDSERSMTYLEMLQQRQEQQ